MSCCMFRGRWVGREGKGGWNELLDYMGGWVGYLLPGPVRDHKRGVADVSAQVVHPLVFGEGGVAAVVADDEEAPHEETWREEWVGGWVGMSSAVML